jgi:hypothetical protein
MRPRRRRHGCRASGRSGPRLVPRVSYKARAEPARSRVPAGPHTLQEPYAAQHAGPRGATPARPSGAAVPRGERRRSHHLPARSRQAVLPVDRHGHALHTVAQPACETLMRPLGPCRVVSSLVPSLNVSGFTILNHNTALLSLMNVSGFTTSKYNVSIISSLNVSGFTTLNNNATFVCYHH